MVVKKTINKVMTRERRAYITLVLLSILLSAGSVAYSGHQRVLNNHKFCEVTDAFVATPVPKPANGNANPSRAQAYIWYERFVRLDKSLGC